MIHLAIDVSEFEHQPTGVGSFIEGLLAGWEGALRSGKLRATLMARALTADRLPEAIRDLVEVRNVGRPQAHPIAWQQTSLALALRRLKADVFFGPAYSLPHLHGTPSLVAMHDLSFERFPESWSRREGLRRRVLARSAARRARRVVTISQFSATELRTLYGVPTERIVVTPLGVRDAILSNAPSPQQQTQLRERLGIDPEARLILHVGTLFERRHVPELIAAVGRAQHPIQLVVVGADRTRNGIDIGGLAADAQLKRPVVHRPWISEEDLLGLYHVADLLVSLSSYEGFGLPVLEALACGLPALVLDRGASSELWAEHAATVPSLDADVVARAIDEVLHEPQRGLRDVDVLLRRHTWQRCADRVLEALEEAVSS